MPLSARPTASVPPRPGVRRWRQALLGRRSTPPADQLTQPADPGHRQDSRSRVGHLSPSQVSVLHRDPSRMTIRKCDRQPCPAMPAIPRHDGHPLTSQRMPRVDDSHFCWKPVGVVLQCVTDFKDCFGPDQSQVRLYTAIARHTVLVMAALAICAITAALLRRRTGTQAPAPVLPAAVLGRGGVRNSVQIGRAWVALVVSGVRRSRRRFGRTHARVPFEAVRYLRSCLTRVRKIRSMARGKMRYARQAQRT